jgi:hypothetical protein
MKNVFQFLHCSTYRKFGKKIEFLAKNDRKSRLFSSPDTGILNPNPGQDLKMFRKMTIFGKKRLNFDKKIKNFRLFNKKFDKFWAPDNHTVTNNRQ